MSQALAQIAELKKQMAELSSLVRDESPVSKRATRADLYADSDTGSYVISSGNLTDIGLEVVFHVDNASKTFYQVMVHLPDVTGTAGSTEARVAILINGIVLVDTEGRIGNNTITIDTAFAIPRGTSSNSGDVTMKVQVQNLSGTVTVDNADTANLDIFQYTDVQT